MNVLKFIIAEIFYYFGLIQAYVLNLLMIRTKVYYEDGAKQNRKIRGKAIIISNHQSPFDGLVIIQKYFFRKVHFILADFFKVGAMRIFAFFIRLAGGVLVDRETHSFDFFEQSLKLLRQNKLVLIFPEGKFSREYEPIRFIYSYLVLSIQSGAKIIPIVSDCNYGLHGRVHIIIGNSIDPSNYAQPGSLSKDALKEINEEIYLKFLQLYFRMKKLKYAKLSNRYIARQPEPGDMIRVDRGGCCHYGVYVGDDEVVLLGASGASGVPRPTMGDDTDGGAGGGASGVPRPTAGGDTDGGAGGASGVPRPTTGGDVRGGVVDDGAVVCLKSLDDFCGGNAPEVRVFKKREQRDRRDTADIIEYAKSCVGQQGSYEHDYDSGDFSTRVVMK